MLIIRWNGSAYHTIQRLRCGQVVIHDIGSGTKLERLLARVEVDGCGREALASMHVSTDLALVEGLGSLGLEGVEDVDSHDDEV